MKSLYNETLQKYKITKLNNETLQNATNSQISCLQIQQISKYKSSNPMSTNLTNIKMHNPQIPCLQIQQISKYKSSNPKSTNPTNIKIPNYKSSNHQGINPQASIFNHSTFGASCSFESSSTKKIKY